MFHTILILAQFVFSAVLVLSASWSPLAVLLATPGISLAVWAWFTMGLRRLRIHPSTTKDTRLIQRGPYAIVRHPMYTGLLWFTAALLLDPIVWWRISIWLALLAVLLVKTREEESAMTQRFAEYADYRIRVGRLFPKVRLFNRHAQDPDCRATKCYRN